MSKVPNITICVRRIRAIAGNIIDYNPYRMVSSSICKIIHSQCTEKSGNAMWLHQSNANLDYETFLY